MSENEVYLIPRDLAWLWGGVPVAIRKSEGQRVARMSDMDVRVGDVVTVEAGEQGKPGYRVHVMRAADKYSGDAVALMETVTPSNLRVMLRNDWTLTAVDRPEPAVPDHAGAMVFVDGGVAVSDGTEYRTWMPISAEGDRLPSWSSGPGDSPVEAIPVPAAALRALAMAEADYDRGATTEDALIGEVEEFRLACLEEWGRSGIVGPFLQS